MGEHEENIVPGVCVEVGGDTFFCLTKGQGTPGSHDFIRCEGGAFGAPQWDDMVRAARRFGDISSTILPSQQAAWTSWTPAARAAAAAAMALQPYSTAYPFG